MNEIPGPGGSAGRDERLHVLLLDYEMAREDERTFNSIQAAMFGVAVALVAGLAALVTRACAFQPHEGAGGTCTHVPEGVLVVTPLAPFALVLFILVLGLVATVRSYYLRALESELRDYAGASLRALEPVRPGSYTELMSELVSLRRGERGYPFLVLMIVVAGLLIFGGFLIYIFSGIDWPGRVFMLILYGPAMLFVLLEAYEGTIGGRDLFNHVITSYVTRLSQGEGATVPSREGGDEAEADPEERSLTSYLILPRPEELPKAVFAPVVFLVACVSLGSLTPELLLRGVIVWFALEYLIYEARYQWNDVRGVGTDYLHRDWASRGRLPLGDDPPRSTVKHMRLSLLVAGLRVAIALGIAFTVGHDAAQPVLALLLAVTAVAVPYELLRSATDDPLTPFERRVQMSVVLWVLVGGGYLIRGVAGLYLAGYGLGDPITVTAAVAFLAYGVMFVTMTWALEAIAHSRRDTNGRWEDAPENPPRFHIGLLRRWLQSTGDSSRDPIETRPLRSSRSFLAPWNLALLCCGGLAGFLGGALVAGGEIGGAALIGGAVTLVAAVLLIPLRGLARWAVYLGCMAILLQLGLWLDVGDCYLAFVPWALFAGLYLSFREQSYESLKRWLPDVPAAFSRLMASVFKALVGERTLRSLKTLEDLPPP